MVTFVLDASAILRFLDGEAGGERVRDILQQALRDECKVMISAVNWGEVIGKLHKSHGPAIAMNRADRLLRKKVEVVPATADRAARSGVLKVDMNIPYADAFGVELACDSTYHVLVTADFDVTAAAGRVSIEFLPRKS